MNWRCKVEGWPRDGFCKGLQIAQGGSDNNKATLFGFSASFDSYYYLISLLAVFISDTGFLYCFSTNGLTSDG